MHFAFSMLKPTVDNREDVQSRSSLGLIPVDQMDGKFLLCRTKISIVR